MFRSQILFVVGAGASKEAELPVGSELKRSIERALSINRLDPDFNSPTFAIVEALQHFVTCHTDQGIDLNALLTAAWQIARAIPLDSSIDDFVNTHSHDKAIELCAKLAITKCILEAEKTSLLFPHSAKGITFGNLDDKWYNSFWRLLSNGIDLPNLDNIFNNISCIVFNYDRCVEHYLVNAICARCLVDIEGHQS